MRNGVIFAACPSPVPMPSAASRNPFVFGRDLTPSELIDRENELGVLGSVARNGGRAILIGERRFGKSSLLRAVAAQRSVRALYYNLDKLPPNKSLAAQIVEDTA